MQARAQRVMGDFFASVLSLFWRCTGGSGGRLSPGQKFVGSFWLEKEELGVLGGCLLFLRLIEEEEGGYL